MFPPSTFPSLCAHTLNGLIQRELHFQSQHTRQKGIKIALTSLVTQGPLWSLLNELWKCFINESALHTQEGGAAQPSHCTMQQAELQKSGLCNPIQTALIQIHITCTPIHITGTVDPNPYHRHCGPQKASIPVHITCILIHATCIPPTHINITVHPNPDSINPSPYHLCTPIYTSSTVHPNPESINPSAYHLHPNPCYLYTPTHITSAVHPNLFYLCTPSLGHLHPKPDTINPSPYHLCTPNPCHWCTPTHITSTVHLNPDIINPNPCTVNFNPHCLCCIPPI